MNGFLKFVFGLVCGLLGVGLILLAAGQPRGQPVTLAPLPTPPPVVVQIDGAVAQPGVYNLPAGSRVRDAIQAAGGLLPAADPGNLNQAAILNDGERIAIPEQSSAATTTTPFPKNTLNQPARPSATQTARPAKKVNINTATSQQLEALPGVGPYLAEQIITYRQSHGAYKTIQAILDVPGIGPKTFEKIKDLITV